MSLNTTRHPIESWNSPPHNCRTILQLKRYATSHQTMGNPPSSPTPSRGVPRTTEPSPTGAVDADSSGLRWETAIPPCSALPIPGCGFSLARLWTGRSSILHKKINVLGVGSTVKQKVKIFEMGVEALRSPLRKDIKVKLSSSLTVTFR